MISLNGAKKSGSGTIVRDVVSFASLMGCTVHLRNIRANRRNPGVRTQHVRAVEAVTDMCGGKVEGAEVGSREIVYYPGHQWKAGTFSWDIGTAGSTTMLASTILPLALFAPRPCRFFLDGGLFQDFAPTALHVEYVLLPVLRRMGAEVSLQIVRPGYVPAGGGRIVIEVNNLQDSLSPLKGCEEQGQVLQVQGVSLSSRLKGRKVSERMAETCCNALERGGYRASIEPLDDIPRAPAYESVSAQPGAALVVWAEMSTGCLLGSDMAGAKGRTSEFIGEHVAEALLADINSMAAVDRYVADQLIPYAALAEGTTRVRIPSMTEHVETRVWLVQEMLGADVEVYPDGLAIQGIGVKNHV